jgi:hypothetical protein
MHLKPLGSFAALSLTGALLLAGCGSSSKPAYCKQVNNFKESVKTLEGVELSPTNLGTIKTDVQNVVTRGEELKSAVGTEFEPQITSMKNSIDALGTTLKEVASSPSTSTIVHAVSVAGTQIEALKKSATEVQEVTKSKC